MTTTFSALTEKEQKALLSICIQAAFADGTVNDLERGEIKRVAESNGSPNLALTYQTALAGNASLSRLTSDLSSPNSKALAHEMAVCICNVDNALNEAEERFLSNLRQALALDSRTAADFQQSAAALREAPPVIAKFQNGATELDQMIRDRAILTGALELMPQTLATMAIVPIQMRMVYQIGKHYGYDLDLSHTKEFLATIGIGLTSQVVEGYVSKLVGQFTRRFAGRIVGALASQATESALGFATTYAVGQAAKSYYESGRTLGPSQLRDVFSSMLNQGRSMQTQLTNQISQRAGTLKVGDFLPLIR